MTHFNSQIATSIVNLCAAENIPVKPKNSVFLAPNHSSLERIAGILLNGKYCPLLPNCTDCSRKFSVVPYALPPLFSHPHSLVAPFLKKQAKYGGKYCNFHGFRFTILSHKEEYSEELDHLVKEISKFQKQIVLFTDSITREPEVEKKVSDGKEILLFGVQSTIFGNLTFLLKGIEFFTVENQEEINQFKFDLLSSYFTFPLLPLYREGLQKIESQHHLPLNVKVLARAINALIPQLQIKYKIRKAQIESFNSNEKNQVWKELFVALYHLLAKEASLSSTVKDMIEKSILTSHHPVQFTICMNKFAETHVFPNIVDNIMNILREHPKKSEYILFFSEALIESVTPLLCDELKSLRQRKAATNVAAFLIKNSS